MKLKLFRPANNNKEEKYLSVLSMAILVSIFAFCVCKIMKRKHREKEKETLQKTALNDPITTAKKQQSNVNPSLVRQFLIGVVLIGIGLIAILLTKTPGDESQIQSVFFEAVPRFNYEEYTCAEIEAGNKFDVFISIKILPNNHDAEVTVSVKPRKIVSVAGDFSSPDHKVTPLKPPSFLFTWPGIVKLTGFTEEAMGEFFELEHSVNSTRIYSNRPSYPIVEFIWYDAVKQAGLFKKRVALAFAERTYINVTQEAHENSYRVYIIPNVPNNTVITFSKPKLELLGNGILVVEKENLRFDYDYKMANSYFEIEYEHNNAEEIRDLLLIVSGIAFGISGNFFADIVSAKFVHN